MQGFKSVCESGGNGEWYIGLKGELISPSEEFGLGKVIEIFSCNGKLASCYGGEALLLLGMEDLWFKILSFMICVC